MRHFELILSIVKTENRHIFCPILTDLSGNTVCPQATGFQKLAKLTIFGIFNELLSPQNVNVARFARLVNKTFSGILKHC